MTYDSSSEARSLIGKSLSHFCILVRLSEGEPRDASGAAMNFLTLASATG